MNPSPPAPAATLNLETPKEGCILLVHCYCHRKCHGMLNVSRNLDEMQRPRADVRHALAGRRAGLASQ